MERSISDVVGMPVRLRCVLKGEHQLRVPGAEAALEVPPRDAAQEAETSPEAGLEESSKTGATTKDVSGASDKADPEEDPMVQEALSLGAEIKNVD